MARKARMLFCLGRNKDLLGAINVKCRPNSAALEPQIRKCVFALSLQPCVCCNFFCWFLRAKCTLTILRWNVFRRSRIDRDRDAHVCLSSQLRLFAGCAETIVNWNSWTCAKLCMQADDQRRTAIAAHDGARTGLGKFWKFRSRISRAWKSFGKSVMGMSVSKLPKNVSPYTRKLKIHTNTFEDARKYLFCDDISDTDKKMFFEMFSFCYSGSACIYIC